MAFSKAIGNLIGGISQQPFTQRADNECENQVNFTNSLDDGLIRRNGSYLSNYYEDLTEIKAFNPIDIRRSFMVYDQNQELRVFGDRETTNLNYDTFNHEYYLGMEEKTVSYENAQTETDFKAYMGVNPNAGFLNINDATFIYNKDVTVETTTGVAGEFIKLDTVILENFNGSQTYSYEGRPTQPWPRHYQHLRYFNYAEWNAIGFQEDIGLSKTNLKQLARFIASVPFDTTRYGGALLGWWFDPQPMNIKLANSYVATATNTFEVNGFIYLPETDDFVEHTVTVDITATNTEVTIPSQNINGEIATDWGLITSIKRISTEVGVGAYAYVPNRDINWDSGGGLTGTATFTHIGAELDTDKNIGTVLGVSIPKENTVENYYSSGSTITSIGDFDSDKTYYTDLIITEGDTYMTVLRPEMSLISDLPSYAKNNSVVKITSGTSSASDDFYVIFNTFSGDDYGSGEWVEYVDPENNILLDLSTMPFTAIFDNNGNVTIYDGGWKSRLVGDTETNQDPYFVGNTINEMFIFENRLGVLSGGDKVTLSGSGDLFNFYRTSVTTIIPSDRIDFIVTSDKLVNFKYAVPFNKAMMLIDDKVQYVMSYQGALSIDTLSVQEVANYNTQLNIRPIKTNNSMFFISDYGQNTQVTKFFSKDIQLVDGNTVTEKVESLLPNSIQNADVASSNDMIALNKKGDDTIYVFGYRTLQDGNEFNNWTKYKFDNLSIQNVAIFNEVMYIFGQYTGETGMSMLNVDLNKNSSLEVMNNQNTFDQFRVGVDNKQLFTIRNQNLSSILAVETKIPFGVYTKEDFRIISADTTVDGRFPYGYRFEVTNIFDDGNGFTQVQFKNPFFEKEDETYHIEKLICGTLFNSEYEFSRLNLRDRNGIPINSGNTQILSHNITHAKTGGYIVRTEILNSDSYDEVFTGKTVGGAGSVLGEAFLDTGDFNVYVGADKNDVKIKIKNYDYLPCELQYAETEVEYSARAGRF